MRKILEGLSKDIFEARYAYPGEKTWSDRSKAIGKLMASAEKDEDKKRHEKKFTEVIANGDFIPGGRIIFGAGRNAGRHNLLNCYVIVPEDSVDSIGKTIQDMYKISCAGGGIGFNFSKIRPKGDDIQNIPNSAPGSVSVMKMIDGIGEHVKAGKNRRTALMGILNVTHPDLYEFLHVKLDKGELTNFNISVAITSRFIEAVELDEEWYFTFNNRKYYMYKLDIKNPEVEGERSKTLIALNEEDALKRANLHFKDYFKDEFSTPVIVPIRARKLWSTIWKNSCESGDPGIYNISLANSYTNVSYFEDLESTNPCGEISLPSYGNCCLGNINLSNMVVDGQVDWKRLATSVRTGIRFLDNVLSVNYFPTKECKEVGNRSRRVGLGVMGLHYMLIKLGFRYGSEASIEFIERLFKTIRDEAYKTSCYLAREKGAFPAFDYKQYLSEDFARTLPYRIRALIKENGIRNAVMLTIPPTGTTAMLMGVSSGVEPIFSAMYKRRYRDGNVWRETVVFDPLFKEYLEKGEGTGSMSDNLFVGAYDITPKDHMAVQISIQKYIDSCISKTINLPAGYKSEDLEMVSLDAASYLKGLTVYRAGSKGNEPLEAIPLTAENIQKYGNVTKEVAIQSSEACALEGGGCG
jgi:ribonucleoside-diphosphate reductase alpha chain